MATQTLHSPTFRYTRLSSIGYVFLVNGGAISWRSTKTPLQVLNAAEAEIVKNVSFFANTASKWTFTNTARRSSSEENAQITLPSAGTSLLSVKTLRWPTSKSSTGVAQRCSLTFLRHHVPLRLFSRFAITSSDTSPCSWLMTTSNYSLICEDAWTLHPSPRISGSGASCLSHSI
jgi:hypothetical protein